MKIYKIVYIGAGSFRFTIPCAMNILDFAKSYHPVELWFVDINHHSLRIMGNMMQQMIKIHKKDIKLHLTTNRKEALPDADYVLISISIGMQKAEWFDIHIPLKFGIPQNTGDTVGPGGMFRGVRTIPVINGMMKDIQELAPNATILNYTNPQGFIMQGARQAEPKLQSIGLCHELFYLKSKKFGKFMSLCGVDPTKMEKFKLKYGGLNHFSWITELKYGGKDLYPKMREIAEVAYETGKFKRPYNYYLLKKYGYLCYVGDRHIAEFLPQYYNFFNYKDGPFGIVKVRNVYSIHKQRTLIYKLVPWASKNRNRWFIKLLIRPMEGGERALLMAKDNESGRPRHHVCNVPNKGIISNLPENCIVEVPCYFKNGLLKPSKIGPLPKPIDEFVRVHAKNQQLLVDAANSGNPDDLLKALLSDPMCQFIEDEEKIEAMMWNMLYYEKKWLTNFSESIPNPSEIKKMKYSIEKNDLLSFSRARMEKYSPDPSLISKAWPQLE